jgi:hypothetical protein
LIETLRVFVNKNVNISQGFHCVVEINFGRPYVVFLPAPNPNCTIIVSAPMFLPANVRTSAIGHCLLVATTASWHCAALPSTVDWSRPGSGRPVVHALTPNPIPIPSARPLA